MAQLTNVYDSYDAVNINKESLHDIITVMNPELTPFLSMAEQQKVTATLHEWTADTMVAFTTNAQLEGDEYTNTAITAPSRLTNQTQILNKVVSVTGTEKAVGVVGQDAMAYNIMKFGQLLKNDLEFALLGNTAADAGSGTTPSRTMRGFEAWVPNTAANSMGTGGAAGTTTQAATDATTANLRAFTETQFTTVLQAIYTAGGNPNVVMMNPNKAMTFAGFSGNNSRQLDAALEKVVARVKVYASHFGDVEVYINRAIRPNSTTVGRSVLVFDKSKVAVGYLRPIEELPIAKTGDADRTVLQTEATFVAKNSSGMGRIADLLA